MSGVLESASKLLHRLTPGSDRFCEMIPVLEAVSSAG